MDLFRTTLFKEFSANNFLIYHLWNLEVRLETYFETIYFLNFTPVYIMMKYFLLDYIIKLIEVKVSMEKKTVYFVMNRRIKYMRKLYRSLFRKIYTNIVQWRTVDLILCIKQYPKVYVELSNQGYIFKSIIFSSRLTKKVSVREKWVNIFAFKLPL